MRQKRGEFAVLLALFAFLFALYSLLPSVGGRVYASPDETAMAVITRQITSSGQAYLTEPLAEQFPWLHPRSWLSVGDKIAPVSFLGWPWILSFFYRLGGDGLLPWLGALLMLSVVWPFFRLLHEWFETRAALIGTIIAFTVPSVILYANRGLFSNTAVLALGIWSVWLIRNLRAMGNAKYFLTGFVCALSGAVRPIELLWLAPWWVWAGWSLRPTKKQWVFALAGALIVLIPILVLASGAYGSFLRLGYWMHDNPGLSAPVSQLPTVHQQITWLPYGFHPHNLAWNVVAFLGGLFLPWMITLVLALFFSMRGRRMRQLPAPIFLAAWTAFVLLLVYGSAMYADHVRPGAVTIGNSFLRYLLPLAPLIGWAAASLWQHAQRFPLGRIIALVGVIALVGLGGYRAVFGDDEALLFTRHELVRYSQIRSMSHEWFRPGDVIFSERSDKIFFPEFRAVSPLPPKEEIARLASIDSVRLGLFIRTLSQAQKDAWLEAGVDAQELASFGNERLYRLVPRSL